MNHRATISLELEGIFLGSFAPRFGMVERVEEVRGVSAHHANSRGCLGFCACVLLPQSRARVQVKVPERNAQCDVHTG